MAAAVIDGLVRTVRQSRKAVIPYCVFDILHNRRVFFLKKSCFSSCKWYYFVLLYGTNERMRDAE